MPCVLLPDRFTPSIGIDHSHRQTVFLRLRSPVAACPKTCTRVLHRCVQNL
jgi:hypothetical protein